VGLVGAGAGGDLEDSDAEQECEASDFVDGASIDQQL
jgi:hypothetical protein